MAALSLKATIEWLEQDLPPNPPRYKLYDSLPFAILRYDPQEEWVLRREMRLLGQRLSNRGRRVHLLSLAQLLWEAIEKSEGSDALIDLERQRGFTAAQEQANTYLTHADFAPLPDLLEQRLQDLDPDRHICFLWRAASMGPSIYHLSKLLEEMEGRTGVPTILFYPGTLLATNALCFMGLPDREPPGNYRVKIYG